ncbi:MAG: tRNA pseudouridine(13) synthase TruD [Promethearchaeia archaeon]
MDYDVKFEHNNESEIENFVGIEIFSTSEIEGIGGIYKDNYKDFIVKEIIESGKVLEIKEDRETNTYLPDKDNFTTFNLIKINMDTFEAVKKICRELKIPREKIFYSGLKDKCSISVQKISIKGNYIEDLKNLNIREIFIRSIRPTKKPVNLGSNRGNNFTIVIRKIKHTLNLKNKIEDILKKLRNNGFPNYFGLQRFGKYRPNSHLIGRALLEEDYEEAFKVFVSHTYSSESLNLSILRKEIGKSLDNPSKLKVAYKKFPKSLSYECKLIEHVIQYPGDYKGAFGNLNPDLLNLIINAFQSYLFNKMISLRVKKGYPLFQPVEGDCIGILDDINGNLTDVRYCYGKDYDNYLDKAIELNRATIVIPIIGFDTDLDQFPLMNQLFEEIRKEENLSPNIFNSHFLDKYDLKGSIRAQTVKPIGLELVEYLDDEIYPENKKIKIEFSLNKGSYATMLLREIIK